MCLSGGVEDRWDVVVESEGFACAVDHAGVGVFGLDWGGDVGVDLR